MFRRPEAIALLLPWPPEPSSIRRKIVLTCENVTIINLRLFRILNRILFRTLPRYRGQMDILLPKPISDVKRHLNSLVAELDETDRPLIIGNHSTPVAVLLGFEAWQDLVADAEQWRKQDAT